MALQFRYCPVNINLSLLGSGKNIPASISERLPELPNADQAYAIVSSPESKTITIVANEPPGLLYGAATLSQLMRTQKREISKETKITVPFVNIVDWPDMEERGFWLTPRKTTIPFFSEWKLNLIENIAYVGFDKKDYRTVLEIIE